MSIQRLSVEHHSHVSCTALRTWSRLGVQKLARLTTLNSSWGQDSSAWHKEDQHVSIFFGWIQWQFLRPSAKRIWLFRPVPAHQHKASDICHKMNQESNSVASFRKVPPLSNTAMGGIDVQILMQGRSASTFCCQGRCYNQVQAVRESAGAIDWPAKGLRCKNGSLERPIEGHEWEIAEGAVQPCRASYPARCISSGHTAILSSWTTPWSSSLNILLDSMELLQFCAQAATGSLYHTACCLKMAGNTWCRLYEKVKRFHCCKAESDAKTDCTCTGGRICKASSHEGCQINSAQVGTDRGASPLLNFYLTACMKEQQAYRPGRLMADMAIWLCWTLECLFFSQINLHASKQQKHM